MSKNQFYKDEIQRIKKELDITIVAHFYQRDEIFNMADIVGDSLELAKKSINTDSKIIVFCGVAFMGESVKLLDPSKRVFMPKSALCSMARMIDGNQYDDSIKIMEKKGIKKENILPITYINSNAEVKARVGKMGGLVCTSSNAKTIITKALKEDKKIFFLPDRCLGQNISYQMGLKSAVIGQNDNLEDADIICYDGFCSVHQLFTVKDIEFYRKKYNDILIAVHPECDPEICKKADFIGSTSQIIEYVKNLDIEQKVAIGTEFNMVNRLRDKNTFVLSSTKPECPTMNETTIEELYNCMKSIENKETYNEIKVENDVIKWGSIALKRMLEI